MAPTYNQRYDGEWVDVTEERFYACCDCGLVHSYEHIIIGDRILRRVFRDNICTANRRKTNEVRASIKRLSGKVEVMPVHTKAKRAANKRKAKKRASKKR